MKTILKSFGVILLIMSLSLFISSCGDGNKEKQNKKDSSATKTTDINESNVTFYLIPSAKDMFTAIKDENLQFVDGILNPKENAEKYLDVKSQEMGFGIYSADLAYAAAFSKNKETEDYLKIVRNLSDIIGISAVFDESLMKRTQNMSANRDSLMKITNDTYRDIVNFLENDKRKSTLAFISTGGWLESLYIVANTVTEYKKDDKVVQFIADQKNIIENLFLYLENLKDQDSNIADVLKDIKELKDLYDNLSVVKVEMANDENIKEGTYVVGEATKIAISKAEFEKLKETIIKVRNNFANNNV